jgi:hypothetical protein
MKSRAPAFSLVEVVLALGVVSFAIVAILGVLPTGLQTAWDLTLRNDIRRQLVNGHTDLQHLKNLVEDAKLRGTEVLNADISYATKNRMERLIRQIAEHQDELEKIHELREIATLMMPLPIGLNLAGVQNTYWHLRETLLPELRRRAAAGDAAAQQKLHEYLGLGERLGFAKSALE